MYVFAQQIIIFVVTNILETYIFNYIEIIQETYVFIYTRNVINTHVNLDCKQRYFYREITRKITYDNFIYFYNLLNMLHFIFTLYYYEKVQSSSISKV